MPERKVLLPTFFLRYVNDILNEPCAGNIIAFAADTANFYKEKNY